MSPPNKILRLGFSGLFQTLSLTQVSKKEDIKKRRKKPEIDNIINIFIYVTSEGIRKCSNGVVNVVLLTILHRPRNIKFAFLQMKPIYSFLGFIS